MALLTPGEQEKFLSFISCAQWPLGLSTTEHSLCRRTILDEEVLQNSKKRDSVMDSFLRFLKNCSPNLFKESTVLQRSSSQATVAEKAEINQKYNNKKDVETEEKIWILLPFRKEKRIQQDNIQFNPQLRIGNLQIDQMVRRTVETSKILEAVENLF